MTRSAIVDEGLDDGLDEDADVHIADVDDTCSWLRPALAHSTFHLRLLHALGSHVRRVPPCSSFHPLCSSVVTYD